jgi:hypothetical protein
MAKKIVQLLDTNPMMETVYGWDYHWPAVLDRPFLISKNSYVEHLGRDIEEAGLHSFNSGKSRELFLQDLERDRALLPTEKLIELTNQAVSRLFDKSFDEPSPAGIN